MKSLGFLLFVSTLAVTAARAASAPQEVIQFKNGDRLTGTFEHYVGGKIVFKTANVGEVSISPDKVQSFSTAQPAVIQLKQGKIVKGTLSLNASGNWTVQPAGQTPSHFSPKDVEAAYPISVYNLSQSRPHRSFTKFWHGNGNLGYTLENGDQSAKTMALGFSAIRMRPPLPGAHEHYRTDVTLSALLASTSTLQGVRTRTNSVDASLRQDFFLHNNPNNFLFVLGQLDHIEAQSLALRQTYGGGFGRDVIRKPNKVFSVLGGMTYVHSRFFSQPGESKGEGLAGEKLSLHIWRLTLNHQLSFYPGLTNAGQYRFDTITTLGSPITKRLNFQVGFTDHFLSNPLPGHKKSDVIFTTGVGLNF